MTPEKQETVVEADPVDVVLAALLVIEAHALHGMTHKTLRMLHHLLDPWQEHAGERTAPTQLFIAAIRKA